MASQSSTDTEVAPIDWATLESLPHDGDFARLFPFCPQARRAFHQVVLQLNHEPDKFAHARNLIHYDTWTNKPADYHDTDISSFETITEQQTTFTGANNMDTNLDAERASQSAATTTGLTADDTHFCGFYRLSLRPDRWPLNLWHGWVMGKGRPDRDTDSIIDFLLAPEHGPREVRGRHCRFRRDLKTGTLFLISDHHSILVNGSTMLAGRRGASRDPATYQTVVTDGMSISIGGHIYRFRYTHPPQDEDRRLLQAAVSHFYDDTSVPQPMPSNMTSLFSPTPNQDTVELHGYLIQPADRGGTTCRVATAQNKATGEMVVVKALVKNQRTRHAIRAEINTLNLLAPHKHIVRLLRSIDPHESEPNRFYRSNESINVLLVLAPAATITMSDILDDWSSDLPSFQAREIFLLEVIAQAADGLNHIHSKGLMHRDIKPDNLAFVTTNPVHLVILDLGAAESKTKSTRHKVGTIWYFAPELWAVKNRTSSVPFDAKVDVFALGATLYDLLMGGTSPNPLGAPASQTKLHATLSENTRPDKRHNMPIAWQMAQKLLEPDPAIRPSAAEVMQWVGERLNQVREHTEQVHDDEQKDKKRRRINDV